MKMNRKTMMLERKKGRRRRRKKLSSELLVRIGNNTTNNRNLWLTMLILIYGLVSIGLTDIDGAKSAVATTLSLGRAHATQELAEGLTLEPPPNNNNNPSDDLAFTGHHIGGGASGGSTGGGSGDAQWPLHQLDRIKSESKVSALVGQNVILNCAVQFKDGVEKPFVVNWLKYPYKLPIYIWYVGYPPHVAQAYENRVSRIGQASLNLSQVRESDQGLYECKIHYLGSRPGEDKANATWIFLDVQAPPHFTQTPAPVSYVQAGDSLHLTCQAESTPTPILRWYKNKVPIDSDNGPYRLSSSTFSSLAANEQQQPNTAATSDAQQQQQQQPTSGTSKQQQQLLSGHSGSRLDLFIDNIQAGTTTGDYVCLASNSEGSVEARSQVMLAVPAVITTMPRNQTRLESEKVELVCQAKAVPSNITYKWLYNDKPIQTLKWFESRHSIRRDGTLVIHSLHRDDQGEYKCQATNGVSHRYRAAAVSSSSSNKKLSSSLSLSSELAPIYAEASAYLSVEYPARITYSPLVQYLPLGLSGVIRCFVQSAPPVEFFTWTLNNQQFDPNLDPNLERLKNGSLLVRQVSKQYEGKYRCTAFNKHGSAGSSSAMDVRVEEPPYFELKPAEFYKANINGHVKIPCDGKGMPKPNVYWRRIVASSSAGQAHSTNELKQHSVYATNHHTTFVSTTTTSSSSSPGKSLAVADEIADEPDADHHLYSSGTVRELDQHGRPLMLEQQQTEKSPNGNVKVSRSDNDAYEQQQQSDEEQQSVIVYAKLPSDRSEYKNSHLLLHGLRKEDHGRYECVVENEVATLIASTMLYIEETTPHAPTNVQVQTKAWSAHLTWTPGYDGGFEQSFVVWYRQVDKPAHSAISSDETADGMSMSNLAAPASPIPLIQQQQQHRQQQTSSEHHELIDFNWRSINVQPGDATSFTVQNLSQDTSYEFYVRAKNIIGEGPRSQVMLASTKRAISGSLAPVNVDPAVASSTSGPGAPADEQTLSGGSVVVPDEDDNDNTMVTLNPSVLGIIHLVDVSTTSTVSPGGNTSDSQFSASQQMISIQQQQQQQQTATDSSSSDDATSSSNSSKVIRIYLPARQTTSLNSSDSPTNNSSSNNKRPRFDQPESSSSSSSQQNSTDASPPSQAPIQDLSTAPQNVSMMKVAQGWVINWSPPMRLVAEKPSLASVDRIEAAASSSSLGNSLLPALSQVQSMAEFTTTTTTTPTAAQRQQSNGANSVQPAAYSVEFREKDAAWQTLAASRERSLLLKDLKPGNEYMFRIFAHSSTGTKGAPSPEFKYLIPDNRKKPGSTQAFSAGVVSGILFFVACIVIAVCAVNMCNKRRKKRAEKAAYVMMACPVLESHHDIAALNSNSLLKNSSNSPQGRVSGVNQVTPQGGHLTRNIQLSSEMRANGEPETGSIQARLRSISSGANKHLFRLLKIGCQTQGESEVNRLSESQPTAAKSSQQPLTNRRIKFTSNVPLPVDVSPLDDDRHQMSDSNSNFNNNKPTGQLESLSSASDEHNNNNKEPTIVSSSCASGQPPTTSSNGPNKAQSPIDDYWVRKPSDRKWGTLTLAGSKLAERRAREAELKLGASLATTASYTADTAAVQLGRRETEVDSLADEYYTSGANTRNTEPNTQCTVGANAATSSGMLISGSRTLPRSFRESPIRPTTKLQRLAGDNLQLQNQSHHQQFNSWLQDQLGPANAAVTSMAASTAPADRNGPQSDYTQPPPITPPRQSDQLADSCSNAAAQLPPKVPPRSSAQHRKCRNNLTTLRSAWDNQQQPQQSQPPQQLHQRSLSQVDPSTLANYWLFQDQLQLATSARAMASQWDAIGQQQQHPMAVSYAAHPQHQLMFYQQQLNSHFHSNYLAGAGAQMNNTSINNTSVLSSDFYHPDYFHHVQAPLPHLSCSVAATSTDVGDAVPVHCGHQGATIQQQQQLNSSLLIGKRNSLARSTLPMAAAHPSYGQVILAPPYHYLPGQLQSAAVSTTNNGPAFKPEPVQNQTGSATTPSLEPICPFYPMIGATNNGHANNIDALDDPVTENACLGSYKRKRRLPHIEAQFTITPPELPPRVQRNAGCSDTGEDESNDSRSAARRERDAVESGHLFVRSVQSNSICGDLSKTARGLPQPGQRSEQRRLPRPPPQLAQVETIGAREKIETYLRHYETTLAAHDVDRVVGQQTNNGLPLEEEGSPPVCSSPLEVDKLDELTFQPYHNLPSLKYTINLPLRRAHDGTLLLDETSHLRRSRRRRDHHTQGTALSNSNSGQQQRSSTLTFGSARHAKQQPPKTRLGSTSSCPAPPAEFASGYLAADQLLAHQLTRGSRYSLESAIGQPTVGHPNTSIGATKPVDSLENKIDSMVQVRGDERPNEGLSVYALHDKRCGTTSLSREPFYLRSPTLSPGDYSSIRENLLLEPPPPVPPHRPRQQQRQQTLRQQSEGTSSAESELRSNTPEPDFGLREPTRVKNQSMESIGEAASKRDQQPNSSSSSSSSSASSSASSSSAATTTENGGAVSESLTNDHSVDENYEFDLVSSSSSTAKHKTKQIAANNRPPVDNRQQTGGSKERKVAREAHGELYSQVDKSRGGNTRTASDNERQLVERTRFYHYSTRKEQKLAAQVSSTQAPLPLPQTEDCADYYDTVYESLNLDVVHQESSSTITINATDDDSTVNRQHN